MALPEVFIKEVGNLMVGPGTREFGRKVKNANTIVGVDARVQVFTTHIL